MSIPFDRLGAWFKLFSILFYPRRARGRVFSFIGTVEPSGLVADIGGGTGTLLDLAHTVRPDLTYLCVDPARGMLKYVRPYAYRVAARSEDLPFLDGAAGAVMIGDAIHHFTDIGRALEEVRRVLKPGGRLFVFDIDPETLMGRMVVALEGFLGEPANFSSPRRLEELLAGKGFAIFSRNGGFRYTLEAEKPFPAGREA